MSGLDLIIGATVAFIGAAAMGSGIGRGDSLFAALGLFACYLGLAATGVFG